VHASPPTALPLQAEVHPRVSANGLSFDAVVRGGDGVVYAELEGYRTSALPGSVGEAELAQFRAVGRPAP
jgi:hypothetical protein